MRRQVRAEPGEVETPRPATTTQGDQFLLGRDPAIQLREGVDHWISVTEVTAAHTGVAHATTSSGERTRQGRTSRVGTEGRTGVVLVVVVDGATRPLSVMERSAEDPEGERVDIIAGVCRPVLVALPDTPSVLRALHGLEPLDVLRGQVDDHRRAPASYAAGADRLRDNLRSSEVAGEVGGNGVDVHEGSRARSAGGTTPPNTYNITSFGDLATTCDKWLQRFSSTKGTPYRMPW